METLEFTLQVILGIGGIAALTRIVRGPNLVDRIVALDLMLLLIAAALALAGLEGTVFFPVLIVVALVAFTGTVVVARFVEWRDTE